MHIQPTSIPVLRAIGEDFILLASKAGALAYHIASGDQMGKEGFIQYCTAHYGDVALTDAEGNIRPMASGACWWNWSDTSKRVVRRIVMEPTSTPELHPGADRTVYNRWYTLKKEMETPDLGATVADIMPLIDHLRYISDNDAEGVTYFLHWLAWLWQHPEAKIPVAIMLYSRHTRIGKSILAKLLQRVFGKSLVKSIDGLKMHGNFMDAFEHKRIAVLNELARTDKADSYERFKSLVSEEQMEFEGKGRASQERHNCLHFIITTNNSDALPLMQGDGRVLVLRCEAQRRPNEYYRDLLAWIEGPGPALVAGAFAQWKFPDDWDHKAPSPQTAASVKTQREARGVLYDMVAELIEAQKPPFDKDMGRYTSLVEQLHMLYPGNMKAVKLNNKTLPAVLTDLGAEQIQTNYMGKSGKKICAQVWCWRNQEKWKEASGEERALHFDN